MKIVKFKDGQYGLRKWTIFGYEYFDLKSPWYWWGRSCSFFIKDCRSDLESVQRASAMFDKGQPV